MDRRHNILIRKSYSSEEESIIVGIIGVLPKNGVYMDKNAYVPVTTNTKQLDELILLTVIYVGVGVKRAVPFPARAISFKISRDTLQPKPIRIEYQIDLF